MPVLDIGSGPCPCGWLPPKTVVMLSDAPELIPGDIEIEYSCPVCVLRHFIEFTRDKKDVS